MDDLTNLHSKLVTQDQIDKTTQKMIDQIIYTLREEHQDVFLTGGAGVGKTYLVNQICQDYTIMPIKLASTGVAANLIKGETVHRFYKLGISQNIEELKAWDNRQAENFARNSSNLSPNQAYDILMGLIRKNLAIANIIIIDEVSMLSDKVIDMIKYRHDILGIRIPILYVGDFYQLPPVDKSNTLRFAFNSPNWNCKVFELTDIKRTSNVEFASLQHKVRLGIKTPDVIDYINKLAQNPYNKNSLHLFSTNKEIDNFNITKLKELPGTLYKAQFQYNDQLYSEKEVTDFIKDLLIQPILYFKIGARVLFLTNQNIGREYLWYNGEQGTIINATSGMITVKKDNGEVVDVTRETFEKKELKKGEFVTKCAVNQFPLRLAYAISIHKSQGLSLESGHIDCTKFFLPEQFFVGLSRFTDPTKLSISNFRSDLIQANPIAKEFYQNNPNQFDPDWDPNKPTETKWDKDWENWTDDVDSDRIHEDNEIPF